MTLPLMPKATAVWLVENTTLTFTQIADFCGFHVLEIQAIADGDVASNIMGLSPIANGQLTEENIKACEKDASASLTLIEKETLEKNKKKSYMSSAKRESKRSAVAWLLKNYPDLSDTQLVKLMHTTKPTIENIRKNIKENKPLDPRILGLCTESELQQAVAVSVRHPKI
ncbi:MAG: DUF1013 domain-containing protein [Alphaproteobacteria bacterium]|nr:DUF1013 domain-containing protein [Alphaproteobacteria bacterium]NCB49376.1 DUF1013 domain-containing protein [Alphaproteobacteria bacterium]